MGGGRVIVTKEHRPERPKIYVDARGEQLRDVALMKGNHYAIRIGHLALSLSVGAAEAMAWAVLQRQAKRQKKGGQ
jgi:hypothetical protein